MMDDYQAGKCKALAIGTHDVTLDQFTIDRFCEIDLVYTDSLIAEIPIAFPVRDGISSGLSYWMYEGQRSGITIDTAKEEFMPNLKCNIHIEDVRKVPNSVSCEEFQLRR